MILRILPSASEDLAASAGFYNGQEAGVGAHFLESIFTDIDSLVVTAGVHRKVFGFHRLLAATFPYAVYYLCDRDVVEIWAVLDCRREPKFLQRVLRARAAG